jgi:hypothetical protein
MVGVGSACQRYHANIEREPEHNLVDGAPVPGSDLGQLSARQGFTVGGQQGESVSRRVSSSFQAVPYRKRALESVQSTGSGQA